jgi:alkylated DNA repair dioxygenase AlkB
MAGDVQTAWSFGVHAPSGFRYREDFVTREEEARLVAEIGRVEFSPFEMRGVVARRRVAFFGASYDARVGVVPPIPAFLTPLRDRVATWAGVDAQAFAMALVNAYPPGAPIGWHRDAPQYGVVAGLSLLSICRMRFRPYVPPGERAPTSGRRRRSATHEVDLAPRSAYLLAGEARSGYEHHIPPVGGLRYSITFRTLRPGHAPGPGASAAPGAEPAA